ncbi:MAG TPA: serine hydrolase [Gaiellaceae bacterium]
MRAAAVVFAALGLASAAAAGDNGLLAAQARYLPQAQRHFSGDADGLQARYDAARDLEEAAKAEPARSASCRRLRSALLRFAHAQVAIAEASDYPVRRGRPYVLPHVPASCSAAAGGSAQTSHTFPSLRLDPAARIARPESGTDVRLESRLAAIGLAYRGWAGFWVHDLRTGRTAGWNSDAFFAAGSAVKLGPLLAALPSPSLVYDVAQIGAWSSNLAANRIVEKLGLARVNDALRRLGMWSSTYPGLYRAGTSARRDAPKPPPRTHTRLTTAHDLGRALYRIHAAALGNRLALRQLGVTRALARVALARLLASLPLGDNKGLVRPWLPRATIAQKNAWLSDLRTTAAIVYRPAGPVIVVVEASRPGITTREARALGAQVVRAAGL